MKKASKETWPKLFKVHTIVFDFDGVFTNNKVYINEVGTEWVRCDRADGLAIDFLQRFKRMGKLTANFFILSMENNPVVVTRAKKLGLECRYSIANKLSFLSDYFSQVRPTDPSPFAGLIYLGNDLNDLPVMEHAGFSVAPLDAHERVKTAASVVLSRRGGDGFVREFVERLLCTDEMTKEELYELIHSC